MNTAQIERDPGQSLFLPMLVPTYKNWGVFRYFQIRIRILESLFLNLFSRFVYIWGIEKEHACKSFEKMKSQGTEI